MTGQLSSIVLAAGLSRRMGKENKLLLTFRESTLLGTTLSHILAARVGETLLVVGHEAAAVTAALTTDFESLISYTLCTIEQPILATESALQMEKWQSQMEKGPLSIKAKNGAFFTILTNKNYENGMTTSIQTGVAAANADSIGYMICLSDMPFIAPTDYQFLTEQFKKILAKDRQAIVQPTFEGQRGNPTIFANFYRKHILNLTYTEGCKPIVQAHLPHVYTVEMPTNSVLKDIDSPEAYAVSI